MGMWDRIKKSINPGEDDDNTYDDDEFEDEYSMGSDGFDVGMNDMSGGAYSQHNPVYTQNAPNYNNFQTPVNNNMAPATTSVTSVSGGDMQSSVEIKVIKPEAYNDCRRISNLLMARKTVIINFEETNKEVIRKILDFVAGALYVLNGQLSKVTDKTFIATPPNAKVSEEQIKNAERNDMGRDTSIY